MKHRTTSLIKNHFSLFAAICLILAGMIVTAPVFAEVPADPAAAATDAEPAASSAAPAATPPGNPKLHITADSMVANQNSQQVVFTGNVTALYDAKEILSDELRVFYDKQAEKQQDDAVASAAGVNKIIASGQVRITFEENTATCDQAVYTAATNTMVLTGQAVKLQNKKNFITGSKITIYQDSGQILVDGDNGKRVNAVFHPDKNDSISE